MICQLLDISIINNERNYCELKEALEWLITKEIILKKINLIEEGKNIVTDEVIN